MATDPSAHKRILLAAERLFAERGIDAVSLREIGGAAGQRNNSAVQYHFGGKDGLVRALYELRLPPLNRRRHELLRELLATGRASDLHALVDAYARPLAEAIVDDGGTVSSYARFVTRFLADRGHDFDAGLGDDAVGAIRDIHRLLERRLSELPRAMRRERLRHMTILVTSVLADVERRQERNERIPLRGEALIANLVDSTVGLLAAPSSGVSRMS